MDTLAGNEEIERVRERLSVGWDVRSYIIEYMSIVGKAREISAYLLSFLNAFSVEFTEFRRGVIGFNIDDFFGITYTHARIRPRCSDLAYIITL